MTTTAEKIAVMQAFEEGKQIEYFSRIFDRWVNTSDPIWDWLNCEYRIAVTKPSINWDHVSPEYNWLARNESYNLDLNCFLFEKKPRISGWSWVWEVARGKDKWASAEGFASLERGTCDWRDSLVKRPNYFGE